MRLAQINTGRTIGVLDVFADNKALDYMLKVSEDPSILKIFHNAKFDLSFLRVHAGRRVQFRNIFDTMLAEQVLTAGWCHPYLRKSELKKRAIGYSLKDLVSRHLGQKLDKSLQTSDWGGELSAEQIAYASRDVEVLPHLYKIQKELLELNELTQVADLEFQTIPAIIEMELFGMPIDWSLAETLRETKRQEYQRVLEETEQIVRKSQRSRQTTLTGTNASVDLNVNSPIQVLRYLQDKLGFEDLESSGVETLKSLDHPVAAKFLELRTLEKHLNFLDQLESFGGGTGRLYPNYNQCQTATGRMSSYRYNQQQVPKRGSGAVFRTLFRAQPGWKLVIADFSAIEMRVMAAVCQDPQMVEAIKAGVDLHKLTASKVLNKPLEEVTKEDRQQAKAVNFGFLYGMTSSTFQKYAWLNYGVHLSKDQANKARKAFFELYPELKNWHWRQKLLIYHPEPFFMHSGRGIFSVPAAVQRTVLGRARYWANFRGKTLARPNEFYNSAIQGTSADITKQTLVELYATLPDSAHLVGVVHDEILVEAPESIAEEVKELMLRTMQTVGSTMLEVIPVEAEAVVGDSWGS